jgi:hypothetical protein
MIILLIALWIFVGLVLAGFLFGPFYYNEHEVTWIRGNSIAMGIIMGPFTLLPVLAFYFDFWESIGGVKWKSVFAK